MPPLLLVHAALALLPANTARAAHDVRRPEHTAVLTMPTRPDVDVVWLDDQIQIFDGTALPLPADAPAYLGATPIQVRSGFSANVVVDVEALRF